MFTVGRAGPAHVARFQHLHSCQQGPPPQTQRVVDFLPPQVLGRKSSGGEIPSRIRGKGRGCRRFQPLESDVPHHTQPHSPVMEVLLSTSSSLTPSFCRRCSRFSSRGRSTAEPSARSTTPSTTEVSVSAGQPQLAHVPHHRGFGRADRGLVACQCLNLYSR